MNVWRRARWHERAVLIVWAVVLIGALWRTAWLDACDALLVLLLFYGYISQGQVIGDLRGQLRALR